VWAALIDVNAVRFGRCGRPIFGYQEWCREVAGVSVGELSVAAMRSVVRRYSDACFETARRRRCGERARYPRRKKALFPLRWYRGTFWVEDGRRVRLSVARGRPDLRVRLARPVPYPADSWRSVTLVVDGGRLCLDVTAAVPIEDHDLDPNRIGGVDVGIIHPFAVASGEEALFVSGRAIRAEERLHLADAKARARKGAAKQQRRGQRGSRRWRRLRAAQRRAEARSRRRVRHAHHQAAKTVVAWAIDQRVGTLVVGDPAGITLRDAGRYQNRRLHAWRRTHLVGALVDKAERSGITVVRVDERRTSSTCPQCARSVPKPNGRRFSCPHCGHYGHRDLVAARNIAARGGGHTTTPVVVTHRRAGTVPARRDRRRHHMDARRSCPAPGHPKPGSRSPVPARIAEAA
jgi:IS605 OrfB family transposase